MGIYLKKMKTLILKDIHSPMLFAVLFIIMLHNKDTDTT